MSVTKILAADVSKEELVCFAGQKAFTVRNRQPEISRLLAQHEGSAVVCEPTSIHHIPLVRAAFDAGMTVHLVNPREARKFKDSLSFRAKTDPLDAEALHLFALKASERLRPWTPPPPRLAELARLTRLRSTVAAHKSALKLALAGEDSEESRAALHAMGRFMESLTARMTALASEFDSYDRVKSIPGVGPVVGCALVSLLESHDFATSDAAVAFVGLDVKVSQSGPRRGRGRLSKCGDASLRGLLCLAGWSLLRTRLGTAKKQELQDRGRRSPERMVIAARKILRTAWKLVRDREVFKPEKFSWT